MYVTKKKWLITNLFGHPHEGKEEEVSTVYVYRGSTLQTGLEDIDEIRYVMMDRGEWKKLSILGRELDESK